MKKISFICLIGTMSILASGCGTTLVKKTVYQGNTVYGAFGDCLSSGAGAADPVNNSFGALITAFLNKLHPNVTFFNGGEGGSTTQSYVTYLPIDLTKLAAAHTEPLARATLLIGMNDLVTIYEGCHSCTYSATYSQGVSASFSYKSEIQTQIDAILKFNPNCNLVLCTIPDPSNDGKGTYGPFNPPGLIKEFNKRIGELGSANHLPVADLYTVMMGHPEWFGNGDVHPNNDGHAVIASVIEAQFEPNIKIPLPSQLTPKAQPTPKK
jgi:lysophospholipase L1-like esterase